MKRLQMVRSIIVCGVVAVIRAESKEQGIKIVDAVKKGGIKAVGIGGELTKGAKAGDYELVTQTAAGFVEEVKKARDLK